jgi:pyrroline-5-carboxylate reductase
MWAAGLERTFGLPPRTALHLASFMVAGASGAMETRNGTDDEAIIDNIASSVVAAAKALKRTSVMGVKSRTR